LIKFANTALYRRVLPSYYNCDSFIEPSKQFEDRQTRMSVQVDNPI